MAIPHMESDSLPPHPVLTDHYADPASRQRYVDAMFDKSAAHYDRITSIMSLGSGNRYRERVLRAAGLAPGDRVVDLACGTGQVAEKAQAIVGPEGEVLGVDPSDGMRAIAERRRSIRTLPGTADSIPVPDAWADFVLMGYALRHVSDLRAAFTEMARVLRPGGKVVILEISAPPRGIRRAALRVYLGGVVPAMALATTASRGSRRLMQYYWDSIASCVAPDTILGAMQDAGLSDVSATTSLGVFNEYTGVRPA